MADLYPLQFEPLFRRYLWGGRRLGTVLGKQIHAGEDYAESWEVVDHGTDQSVVAAGPQFRKLAENQLQGYTLSSPAISRGQIFMRTDQFLYAIGTRH